MHQFIAALKTFIPNIKEAVPISAKTSVKFVKKGAKVPRKRSPPVGILHHVSDWVLIADINSNFCFPVHITFTRLRPYIRIFSNYLRKVILVELACPCQGKMESWHRNKINKYLALKTSIESKGWCVEHFAVEVGVRGYCSEPVLCCFKKPGFSNTFIRNTIEKLSKSSTECSCFVSGWPETIKIGILLLPTVTLIVLDELKDISIAASHLVCNTVSFNTCFCPSVPEENLDIVTLPVLAEI